MRVGVSPVKVDVRIVAATNRDLEDMVRRGTFREDLYYRLGVIEIRVPSLRTRLKDLTELVSSLLPRLCRRNHKPPHRLADAALDRLQHYAWPGNIRELENILERAVVLSERAVIEASDLILPETVPAGPTLLEQARTEGETDHRGLMEAIERERLVSELHATGGNRSSAARNLGIPRTTLLHKLRRFRVAEN